MAEKRFLRLKSVKDKTGLPTSSIYLMMKEGRFPSSIDLAPRTVAWLESEIDDWMMGRINSRK